MKVISTNIAASRTIYRNGEAVETGIYKEAVDHIRIRKFFVENDTVSDTRAHGGEHKAVYIYASEHYDFWQQEFPELTMPWGTFGENITTEQLLEEDMRIGSIYQMGTAILKVTEPRFPCFKLQLKFQVDDMISRFLHSRRSGSYFTVIEEGTVSPGDSIRLIQHIPGSPSILDLVERRIKKE